MPIESHAAFVGSRYVQSDMADWRIGVAAFMHHAAVLQVCDPYARAS